MSTDSPSHNAKGGAQLVAPRRRRHRGWFARRRSSRRGRFELALIGGGAMALLLAATLPGASTSNMIILLGVTGLVMTIIARVVGLAPSLAASVFAPLVIALTDPMWTLGATISDFTLAEESEAAFATFLLATVLGSLLRHWHVHVEVYPSGSLWSATPHRGETSASGPPEEE